MRYFSSLDIKLHLISSLSEHVVIGRPRNLTALSARRGKGSPAIASFGSYTLPACLTCGPVIATATHLFTFAFIKNPL